MKRFITCWAILGLALALGSCSSDSPSADPVPTVVPDSWAVVLGVSDTTPVVGTVILLQAEVRRNGQDAPDGTTVEFLAGGPSGASAGFTATGTNRATVAAEGGRATATFVSLTEGSFTFQAKVNSVFDQASATYSQDTVPDDLQIYDVTPREGSYDGGETVILTGKGIQTPVDVAFRISGTAYEAAVQSVVPSQPLTETGSVTVTTPYVNDPTLRGQSRPADIDVTVGVGTGDSQQQLLTNAFTFLAETGLELFHPLEPNQGPYGGGVMVTIRGLGISAPVQVTFTVEGVDHDARIVNVVDSVPSSTEGQIVVELPQVVPSISRDQQRTADVTVTVDAGTPEEESETLSGAFLYLADDTQPEPFWRLPGPPLIYALVPDHGPSAGGQQVTIFGRNFRAEYIDTDGVTVLDTASAVTNLTFGDLEAEVLSVSTDGTQILAVTPRFSVTALEEDQPVDVVVTTQLPEGTGDTFSYTRQSAYVYLADEPTPSISSVSPIAGPLDGGTPVTILGSGFQMPVQATFGNLACDSLQLYDDTSLADNDRITCMTPDYSQQGETPPVTVDVTVTNLETGKEDTLAGAFTYGDNLYLTGNSPFRGKPGEIILITGSGFEDPLQVFFVYGGTEWELEVLSVSGTQLAVRFGDDWEVECEDQTGTFRVELVEAELEATGGGYTVLGNTPQVFSVDPVFVQEADDGDSVVPDEITITGQNFAPNATVTIQGQAGEPPFVMDSADVTVVDEFTIEADNLPAPNDFGLQWDTAECVVAGAPVNGRRRVPTPVNVVVTNFPGDCPDTLNGGLVYEPEDTTCELGAVPTPTILSFNPDVVGGTCSADSPKTVTITNYSSVEVVWTSTLTTGFAVDLAAGTLNPGASEDVSISFCPPAGMVTDPSGQQLIQGAFTVTSTGPGLTPFNASVVLTGTALAPVISVDPTSHAFGNVTLFTPVAQSFTVSNTGPAPTTLNWGANVQGANAADFAITDQTANTVEITFTPATEGGKAATLVVSDPLAVNSPFEVPLTGTGVAP